MAFTLPLSAFFAALQCSGSSSSLVPTETPSQDGCRSWSPSSNTFTSTPPSTCPTSATTFASTLVSALTSHALPSPASTSTSTLPTLPTTLPTSQASTPQHSTSPTHASDSGASSPHEDQLKLLLDISDIDIDRFYQASDSQIAFQYPLHCPSVAEIKNPDQKESFVHPGFYSLPPQSSTPLATSTLSRPVPSRKTSLQEESTEARFMSMTDYRRHSVDNPNPNPRMAQSAHSYATPYRHSSGPRMIERSDLPRGQPFVAAYLSQSSHHDVFLQSQAAMAAAMSPFNSPKAHYSSASFSPYGRKRRSKFSTDPYRHTYEQIHQGPMLFPVDPTPLPLRQSNPQHPYVHPMMIPPRHHGPRSHSARNSISGPSDFRSNPAHVPASTIPADHFIFQEALQSRPPPPKTTQPGPTHLSTVLSPTTEAATAAITAATQTTGLQAHQHSTLPPQDHSLWDMSTVHSGVSLVQPADQDLEKTSWLMQDLQDYTMAGEMDLSLFYQDGTAFSSLSSSSSFVETAGLNFGVEGQGQGQDALGTDGNRTSSKTMTASEDAAQFAASLTMVDPVTTKMLDQLLLQDYLRKQPLTEPMKEMVSPQGVSQGGNQGLNVYDGQCSSQYQDQVSRLG